VAVQSNDPDSQLNLVKRLTTLRHQSAGLKHGSIHIHDAGHQKVLCYTREPDEDSTVQEMPDKTTVYTVVINFSEESVICRPAVATGTPVVSTHGLPDDARPSARTGEPGSDVRLRPHEAIVFAQV
jgi:glycosidase